MHRLKDSDVLVGVLTNNQSINIQNKGMNNMNNNPQVIGTVGNLTASACDALPKAFVQSMKTLFDILDDQRTGYVKFVDIEKGWQDDGSKGLPRGVIESLRKVTPASGLLTFDRFCAGLKLCLLRNQNTQIAAAPPHGDQLQAQTKITAVTNSAPSWKTKSPSKSQRPPSAPALDIENPLPTNPWTGNRTLSLPQLSPDSDGDLTTSSNAICSPYNTPPPPPKPPRASALHANVAISGVTAGGGGILTASNNVMDKAEIRNALQNWQMGVLRNEIDSKDKQKPANFLQQCGYRGSADGGSSSATDSGNFTNLPLKKTPIKRREPRRHTLQNGIDYNMLKRLKQFEEEREVLLLGLDAVDKARDWYMQQLVNVQDKIKYLGRMGSSNEQWSEVQQERLNFQRARVLEVNRSLSVLADTWERGSFPFHFNLAFRTPPKVSSNRAATSLSNSITDRLRQQNRLLANEGHLKSERIVMLEREKQTLLAELFEMKQRSGLARHTNSYLNVLSQSSPGCSTSSGGGLGDADVVY
ncbi:suppressor APC domain-containing protein 2 isoform X2 [Stomoxys calcitrans]|nr:suppressor APC domain-containing protein 2 isoform X2 [Stomoxys calcitrans]XP_059225367.1 suppressor APC domain-containing protein 2 isoform X2 [Stomoxys calcitrans]XP_059225368.1 suppressor APC domain-containing protein 2 isoform X2 [Stomoxys calcitrans]